MKVIYLTSRTVLSGPVVYPSTGSCFKHLTSRSNWSLEVSVFAEGGKLTNLSKLESD